LAISSRLISTLRSVMAFHIILGRTISGKNTQLFGTNANLDVSGNNLLSEC
jgi:hypothetical protein